MAEREQRLCHGFTRLSFGRIQRADVLRPGAERTEELDENRHDGKRRVQEIRRDDRPDDAGREDRREGIDHV